MIKHLLWVALILSGQVFGAEVKNESELGVKVQGGNTETESYKAKSETEFSHETNKYTLGGHYMYGTSRSVIDTRNWSGYLKYGHKLSEKFSLLAGYLIEGDKFKGIKDRSNYDLGLGYEIMKTETFTWISEAGYRYTIQNNTDNTDQKDSKGRFYTKADKKLREGMDGVLWVEYLYNFTKTEKWILTFEPSLSFVLTEKLFLKLAYKGIYENQPQVGFKKYDYEYITSLMAKF